MAGENDKQVEGLGAGKMQLTGDFILRHEDGTELFKVDADNGNVTAFGTVTGGGVEQEPGGINGDIQYNNNGSFGGFNIDLGTDGQLLYKLSSNPGNLAVTEGMDFNDTTQEFTLSGTDLILNGGLKFTDSPSNGYVLTSDASGNASWQAAPAPSGAAGGDLSGTYPNPSVEALNTTGASVNVGLAAPPTTGQVLTATSATTSTWQTPSAGSPGGADGNVQYNNGGSFGGESNLFYDDANDRLGIGTSAPDNQLHVSGNTSERGIKLTHTGDSNNLFLLPGNPAQIARIGGNGQLQIINESGTDGFSSATNITMTSNGSTNANNTIAVGDMEMLLPSESGRGVSFQRSGSGPRIGTVGLTAGTATVGYTANLPANVTPRFFVTSQADGGTPGFLRVTNITGTSFDIVSSSALDTSTVAWVVFGDYFVSGGG